MGTLTPNATAAKNETNDNVEPTSLAATHTGFEHDPNAQSPNPVAPENHEEASKLHQDAAVVTPSFGAQMRFRSTTRQFTQPNPLTLADIAAANKVPLACSLLSAATYLMSSDRDSNFSTAFKFGAAGGLAIAATRASRMLQMRSQFSPEGNREAAESLTRTSNGMLARGVGDVLVNLSTIMQSLPSFLTGNLATAATLVENAKHPREWNKKEKVAVAGAGVAYIGAVAFMLKKSELPVLAKFAMSVYGASLFANMGLSLVQKNNRLPLAAGTFLQLASDVLSAVQMSARVNSRSGTYGVVNGNNAAWEFALSYGAQLCVNAGLTGIALAIQPQAEKEIAAEAENAEQKVQAAARRLAS